MRAREWIATLVEVSKILELVTADASRLDESLHFRNVCLHLHDGGEKYFITTALKSAIEEAEADVLEAQATGKRVIYAPGYFTLVGNEIIDKVHSMTLKKDQ